MQNRNGLVGWRKFAHLHEKFASMNNVQNLLAFRDQPIQFIEFEFQSEIYLIDQSLDWLHFWLALRSLIVSVLPELFVHVASADDHHLCHVLIYA